MYNAPPTPPRGRISLIALAAAAALVPQGAWALSLVQAPPGSQQPYVAPNVIISVDDSGSMGWRLNSSSTGTSTAKPWLCAVICTLPVALSRIGWLTPRCPYSSL